MSSFSNSPSIFFYPDIDIYYNKNAWSYLLKIRWDYIGYTNISDCIT